MKKNMTYEEAFSELEALVRKIEDPQRNLNGLSDDVKTAMELVRRCKECLKGDEEKINVLLGED